MHGCCWVEVNLATITYWEYYQILNISVSFCGAIVLLWFLCRFAAMLQCCVVVSLCSSSLSCVIIDFCLISSHCYCSLSNSVIIIVCMH